MRFQFLPSFDMTALRRSSSSSGVQLPCASNEGCSREVVREGHASLPPPCGVQAAACAAAQFGSCSRRAVAPVVAPVALAIPSRPGASWPIPSWIRRLATPTFQWSACPEGRRGPGITVTEAGEES